MLAQNNKENLSLRRKKRTSSEYVISVLLRIATGATRVSHKVATIDFMV